MTPREKFYKVTIGASLLLFIVLIGAIARATDFREPICWKPLLNNRYLVFANVCQPTASFSLQPRDIELEKHITK